MILLCRADDRGSKAAMGVGGHRLANEQGIQPVGGRGVEGPMTCARGMNHRVVDQNIQHSGVRITPGLLGRRCELRASAWTINQRLDDRCEQNLVRLRRPGPLVGIRHRLRGEGHFFELAPVLGFGQVPRVLYIDAPAELFVDGIVLDQPTQGAIGAPRGAGGRSARPAQSGFRPRWPSRHRSSWRRRACS